MTTPIIGEGEKLITTVLLNGERLHVRVHPHANGQNVFDAIVQHIGLNEITYFGLMIIKDGEQQFLSLEEKLNKLAKYAPHLWKDDGNCNSSLVFTVFFRVKYYVENICLLQEQQTRHQYYLQLRKDVLENSLRVHDDTSMVLASYALQVELGDYDRNIHGLDYFVPQHYLPAKTIAKLTIPYIKNALPAMHQSHRGLTEGQAEIEFLKEAQKLSEYGVLFHRVYKKEYNKKIPYNLGICVRGLVVYEESGPIRNPICKHAWSKIKKMSFKRSKFIVESDSPNQHHARMMFYTANYKRSRYLLKISSSFFNFQMKMASRLAMLPEYLVQEEQLQLQQQQQQQQQQQNHHQQIQSTPVQSVPAVRIESVSTQDLVDSADVLSLQRTPGTNVKEVTPSNRETPKPPPKPKPEVKQYTLDLVKRDNSFGFSIVGGIELGGIFVKDVTPGGPAAGSGQINAGDRIVQINKDNFENVTRREAINTLRNAPDKSRFIMESFGQNLVIEADASIVTPLAVSAQSLAINQPQIPVPQTERESDFIQIQLMKRDNNYGIGFTGGPELGGVYVKSLLPNGAAEADGRVAIGDRIVEVEHINVENFSRKKIQDLLKKPSNSVVIVLERYKQIPSAGGLMYIDREKVLQSSQNFTSITLNKRNDSLGFSITGGLDLGGIFVKYLNPNGPAAIDGRLEIGDRVVAVNDISLETSTRQKALEIIRTANSPVNLIIEKCVTPGEKLTREVYPNSSTQLIRSDSIKSLPVHRGKRNMLQSSGINFSMQHLPNVNASNAHDVNGNYKDMSRQRKTTQEVFVVDLTKGSSGFGISLTGGIEVGGIYVKAIQPGGVADLDGRISKGDRVIEINARRMDGISRPEAVDWLKSCEVATLVLERFTHASQMHAHQLPPGSSQYSSFDGDFLNIELQKKNNTFGLSLLGGPELHGIFIKNLMVGGPAAVDGRIGKGDRLVEINGVSVEGLNRYQTNDLLKQAPSVVNLLIEKIHNIEDIPSLDIDTYNVELRKGDSGFGLSVTGGAELGGIYIKGILPGSPADADRRIMKGDRLVEVNGVSMDALTKQQAADFLRKAAPVSNLLLERHGAFDNLVLPESDFFTVELHKKQSGYGLNLTGGPEIDGVYVKQVQRDSAADQDGRIRKGDRLITINGRNVENATRQKCTEMLKLSQDIAVLHLERCVIGDDLPPLDTVLTVVELGKGAQGFGMSLTGGPEIGGIFVKALMQGGSAEKDGRILIGDRVVEMNSVSLDGFSRQQATELLKNSSSPATFVLERYKQPTQRRIRPTPHSSGSHLHPSNESSVLSQQNQFSFPLYHGAAPSVPPRHLNNGGNPSKDSAFKRLEQQQMKLHTQQQHLNHDTNAQKGIPISVQHNVQGSPVSRRIPSLMKRQHSLEKTNGLNKNHPTRSSSSSVQMPYSYLPQDTSKTNSFTENRQFDVSGNNSLNSQSTELNTGPLNLIDAPMRTMKATSDSYVDSPQRFLQHFSKSVANKKPVQSRIPMGPISSAIFGPNRENRNVHELTDLNRMLLENPDGHVAAMPYPYDVDTRVQVTRDTVVCLQNGRPTVHQVSKVSSISDQSAPQSGSIQLMSSNDHNTNYSSLVRVQNRGISANNREALTTTISQPKVTPALQTYQETYVVENLTSPKKVGGGLQWMSLNENGTSDLNDAPNKLHGASVSQWDDSVNETKTDSKEANKDLIYTQVDITNGLSFENTSRNSTYDQQTNKYPSISTTPQLPVYMRNTISTPSSSDIPVPLASRFNPISHSLPKGPLGGDYVFEVTLFKGASGLGMNLAGGGTPTNPIIIKKIASGTAADESGQLRIGDIILEVNGKPVSHLSAKEVISILRACPSEVQLVAKRPAFDQNYQGNMTSGYVGL